MHFAVVRPGFRRPLTVPVRAHWPRRQSSCTRVSARGKPHARVTLGIAKKFAAAPQNLVLPAQLGPFETTPLAVEDSAAICNPLHETSVGPVSYKIKPGPSWTLQATAETPDRVRPPFDPRRQGPDWAMLLAADDRESRCAGMRSTRGTSVRFARPAGGPRRYRGGGSVRRPLRPAP
jgi:hypothetical protein